MITNLGMMLMDFETFCADSTTIWAVVGWVMNIFKIIIPILLIIFGSIDFGKAVVGSDDKEIKKAAKQLGFRAAAALVIFILPSLIVMLFGWILEVSNSDVDYEKCVECVNSPRDC